MAYSPYVFGLTIVGVAILGVVILPRMTSDRPLSLPIFYVAFGALVFNLSGTLPNPLPVENGLIAEKLTELGVIIALMGAGLKIDRVPGFKRWESTWRLLGITMPLTIAAAALLGWGVSALAIPTAMLLGAVIAPTDPVLAAETQVEDPMESEEDEPLDGRDGKRQETRFALTSEAGLNDALAFPFTYLAIVMVEHGVDPANWFTEWAAEYVVYRLGVGLIAGLALGWILANVVFSVAVQGRVARSVRGLEAIGATLFIYGLTEIVHGYGFLAVFVGALAIRNFEHQSEYNQTLYDVSEKSEHIMMAFVMVLFGGALGTGLLDPLTWMDVGIALAIVFLVRPLAGLIGLVGFDRDIREKFVMSFLGIRGIGSFFYLAYAINHADFPGADRVWAIVGFVVLVSIVTHGITASPAISWISGRGGPD